MLMTHTCYFLKNIPRSAKFILRPQEGVKVGRNDMFCKLMEKNPKLYGTKMLIENINPDSYQHWVIVQFKVSAC